MPTAKKRSPSKQALTEVSNVAFHKHRLAILKPCDSLEPIVTKHCSAQYSTVSRFQAVESLTTLPKKVNELRCIDEILMSPMRLESDIRLDVLFLTLSTDKRRCC